MDTIGKYRIVGTIGEGGMGRVYEALDPVIGRRVAVKTISLDIAGDDEIRARFYREAQAAGQLSHPNLVTVHDIGEADGSPYIVMEFLEGSDLSRLMRQESIPLDRKMQMMIDICEGLAHAHGSGIVHRDIKPANIFITSDRRLKIVDFGLARAARSDVTQTGTVLGTPHYMSPEQIRGEQVDQRTDIFSAGVLFYELLSGRKVFEADSTAATIYKVLETKPPSLHTIDPGIPLLLSDVIDRAIAKDKSTRYQTSRELLLALRGVQHRPPDATIVQHSPYDATIVRRDPPSAPIDRTASSSPNLSSAPATTASRWRWVAGAAIVAAGVGGFALLRPATPNSQRAEPVTVPNSERPAQSQTPVAPAPAVSPNVDAGAAIPAGGEAAPIAKPTESKSSVDTTPQTARPVAPTRQNRPPDTVASNPAGQRPVSSEPSAPAKVPASTPAPTTTTTPGAVTSPPTPPPTPRAQPSSDTLVAEPPSRGAAPAISASEPTENRAGAAETNVAAIRRVVAQYRDALESRDLGRLKRIWPTLAGRQEDAIRSEFDRARSIRVSLDGVDVKVNGASAATVSCRRQYAVTLTDGQILNSTSKMTMTLFATNDAWTIDAIRYEVGR